MNKKSLSFFSPLCFSWNYQEKVIIIYMGYSLFPEDRTYIMCYRKFVDIFLCLKHLVLSYIENNGPQNDPHLLLY